MCPYDGVGDYDCRDLGTLEREHASIVHAIARRYAKIGGEQADELYQVAWLAIAMALPAYRGQGPVSHWIAAIARRSCLKHSRNERRQRQALERLRDHMLADGPHAGSEEGLATQWHVNVDGIQMDDVYDAVVALPERQRTLFLMRAYTGLSMTDMSQRFGIAVGTVKATLASAKRAVRKRLDAASKR